MLGGHCPEPRSNLPLPSSYAFFGREETHLFALVESGLAIVAQQRQVLPSFALRFWAVDRLVFVKKTKAWIRSIKHAIKPLLWIWKQSAQRRYDSCRATAAAASTDILRTCST